MERVRRSRKNDKNIKNHKDGGESKLNLLRDEYIRTQEADSPTKPSGREDRYMPRTTTKNQACGIRDPPPSRQPPRNEGSRSISTLAQEGRHESSETKSLADGDGSRAGNE